jgi:hypothetical protein
VHEKVTRKSAGCDAPGSRSSVRKSDSGTRGERPWGHEKEYVLVSGSYMFSLYVLDRTKPYTFG